MKRWVVAVFLAACSSSDPKPPPPPPPPPAPVADAAVESPAIRAMNEWFKAFNASDFKAVHAFTVAHMPGKPDVGNQGFRTMTGGFVIKRLRDLSPTSAEAIVKEQKSEQYARAQIDLDPKDPNHVLEFTILAGPTPDEFLTPEQRKAHAIDGPKRATVVNEIAAALAKTYIDAKKAASMAATIRAHLAKGDYDKIVDGGAFAQQLTDDLHADTRDLHMRVMFGPHPKEEPPPPPEADQLAQQHEMNFGFGPIERVAGNVAHVVINGFPDSKLESVKNAIGDLMGEAADADALILDLRTNGGGDSDTVALVASYVFDDKPVHIVDMYEREANKTTHTWTHAKVHGNRFGGKKPVFVLTSKRTFSGGEELAYDLQTTKRATVIGETTGGGAHPVKLVSLDDSFAIMMPFAESISPITHGNWEGTGVIPDVPTTSEAALEEALKRAQAALKHPSQ
ncbi:MAG: S41 family peptidase [Kofleriaceae bacterium]